MGSGTSGFWTRILVVVAVIGLLSPSLAEAKSLSELLNDQARLKKQAEESRKKIEQKKKEAGSLREAITNLDEDIAETAEKISNTEEQIGNANQVLALLGEDISTTQTQLTDLQDKLRGAYVNLYQMSQSSGVETILQTDSLSDLVSQAQYLQAIQSSLQGDIDQANSLKAELEGQKAEKEGQKANLEGLNKSLTSAKRSLDTQKSRKNYLLGVTEIEQSAQEALLRKLEQQKEVVGQEIYNLRRLAGGRFSDGGTGGYPWANADPNGVNWQTLFYYRQCTDYAAWRFESEFGIPFRNTRPGSGSAWNWPALAGDQGYHTSTTPRANALISWNRSAYSPTYGHVAWVEQVNSDGTIDVSEYNFRVKSGFGQRFSIRPTDYGNPTYIWP